MTDCITARMLLNEVDLPIDVVQRFAKKIEETIKDGASKKVERTNIKDVVHKIRSVIEYIDKQIDDQNYKFSAYEYYQKGDVSSSYAKIVVDKYKPILTELDIAIKGTDPQIVEGYAHLTKQQLVDLRNFIARILTDSNKFLSIKTASTTLKGSTKRKVVDFSNNLKYKIMDTELNIKSISPSSIPGCNELWTFNTKNNVLTRFVSTNSKGIMIKGSTIVNINVKETVAKRVKGLIVIPQILAADKQQLKTFMQAVNTTSQIVRNQLREHVLLLRAFKWA